MNVATLERSRGSAGQELLSRVRARFAPPPLLTVSQYADREIVVTSGPLAGTHWQTDYAPYQRGILDAFHEPGVQTVVVMGSSQWGKSSIAINVVAYHIAHDPCPILVVEPTVDPMAKDFARNRLEPIIAASRSLSEVVSKKRAKDASNTILTKTFRGGSLAIGGANSAASLAARSVRLLVLDEIDRYPLELPGEGNTLAIALKRTTSYGRRRRVLILSSPTLKDSPIHVWFQRGDQRRFHVPCPACGAFFAYQWSQVRWVDDDPATARIHCPHCDHGLDDVERLAVLSKGHWQADHPERRDKSIVSFHLWEGYALATDTPIPTPRGWTTMADLQPGDEVFGEDGRRRLVTGTTGVLLGEPCYRVRFACGAEIVADGHHLWRVENASGSPLLLTTKDLHAGAHHPCGARKYAVRTAEPLELEVSELPVDPYILGAWIGDGDSRGAKIFAGAKDADEMATLLRACGPTVLIRRTKKGPCILQLEPENRRAGRFGPGGERNGANPSSITSGLRGLKIVFDGVSRKTIPTTYLRASRAQRLALLQGLMDTDGYIGVSNGECSYSTTSRDIADTVCDLLAGLGLKWRRYERSRAENKREIRLNFTPGSGLPVFRLQRKLSRQARRSARDPRGLGLRRRKIVAVEPVASVPVKCISVDNPTGLYLAGTSMIPTHNSPLSSLGAVVSTFLQAHADQKHGDKSTMHTWQNTTLGEPIEPDQGDGVEPHALLVRREPFDAPAPGGVCLLTMGVDVQDDRLELLVVGWGPGEESWILDRDTLGGDTSQSEPWTALNDVLDRTYLHESGVALSIHAACIDSAGHRTTMVYDYAARKAARRVYAIIGRDGQRPIVSSPSPRRWGREQRKVPLYTVGVDAAKALWVSRLNVVEKGRGYVHLPLAEWCDEELAAQLTSERLLTRFSKGVPVQLWKKMRPRNEALDCAVYALAALRLTHPDLDALAARMSGSGQKPPTPPPDAKPAPGWIPRRQGGWLHGRRG